MNQIAKDIVSLPVSSAIFQASRRGIVSVPGSQIQYNASKFRQSEVDSMINRMSRIGEKVDSFAKGIQEHMRIGSKMSETVKGKLSLGAKILQLGGVKKVFQQNLCVKEGEKLLKVSQSTTAGPLAGLVFISTDKVAFCSERSIKISSSSGEIIRVHYKVVIPLRKIKRANESENVKQPSRKYIQIVTNDNYDFWFMGFLNYRRTLKYIEHALSQVQ